jgi:NTP pyrophosphatase (non-canonical NTP hydrolase)
MQLNEYQDKTSETLLPSAQNPFYLVSGLCGEVGEVASLFAKSVRDGHVVSQVDLRKELGDCLWFIATLADSAGITLEDVAQTNIDKLASRKERGVLQGSGDTR